jgi:hypothetical protein
MMENTLQYLGQLRKTGAAISYVITDQYFQRFNICLK